MDSNHTSYWINRKPAEATSVIVYVHYPLVVSLSISDYARREGNIFCHKNNKGCRRHDAACSPFSFFIQVSQVTSGPRRGPTFNNRWWNDRRSWNLRTTNSREKASPKGANHTQSCSCSPPSGTIREYLSLSAGSIPFGHSTRGYSHSPPLGTENA